jgi:hypothetical protein
MINIRKELKFHYVIHIEISPPQMLDKLFLCHFYLSLRYMTLNETTGNILAKKCLRLAVIKFED